jgi:hypothetical protein
MTEPADSFEDLDRIWTDLQNDALAQKLDPALVKSIVQAWEVFHEWKLSIPADAKLTAELAELLIKWKASAAQSRAMLIEAGARDSSGLAKKYKAKRVNEWWVWAWELSVRLDKLTKQMAILSNVVKANPSIPQPIADEMAQNLAAFRKFRAGVTWFTPMLTLIPEIVVWTMTANHLGLVIAAAGGNSPPPLDEFGSAARENVDHSKEAIAAMGARAKEAAKKVYGSLETMTDRAAAAAERAADEIEHGAQSAGLALGVVVGLGVLWMIKTKT